MWGVAPRHCLGASSLKSLRHFEPFCFMCSKKKKEEEERNPPKWTDAPLLCVSLCVLNSPPLKSRVSSLLSWVKFSLDTPRKISSPTYSCFICMLFNPVKRHQSSPLFGAFYITKLQINCSLTSQQIRKQTTKKQRAERLPRAMWLWLAHFCCIFRAARLDIVLSGRHTVKQRHSLHPAGTIPPLNIGNCFALMRAGIIPLPIWVRGTNERKVHWEKCQTFHL